MEALHVAVAAYLRAQRRQLAPRADEAQILAIWRERCAVPRCRVCGAPVDDDDDGLYNLDDMQRVRECEEHYSPF